MKPFDLMFCCLGNGTTVCDRSREEHSDYKHIAHIASWGGVRISDPHIKCDLDAMERIWKMAQRSQEDYRVWWFMQSYETQYCAWYASMTIWQIIDTRDGWPKEKSPEWLYSQYIINSSRNHGYEMPPA